MLQRALHGATELDLHHYPDLSGSQILALIENASHSIDLLDISFNHMITPEHLSRISTTHPIRTLCAWDNEQLLDTDLLKASAQIENVVRRQDFLEAFAVYGAFDADAHHMQAFRDRNYFLERAPVPAHENLFSQFVFLQLKSSESSAAVEPLFGVESELRAGLEGRHHSDPQLIHEFYPIVMPLWDVSVKTEGLMTSVGWMTRVLNSGERWMWSVGTMGNVPLMMAWALTLRHSQVRPQPTLYNHSTFIHMRLDQVLTVNSLRIE
jgi:hypothetical protein